MNLDPSKFFIGLMDFFSILLPGALLVFFLQDDVGPWLIGNRQYAGLSNAAAIALFAFSAYLAGHLVFLIGASLLDYFYDAARRRTLDYQVRHLARRGTPVCAPWRLLVRLVFKEERNRAVACASALRCQLLEPLQAESAINTFQWAKIKLAASSKESFAVVQRFEADSKFFRSLAVVLPILFVVALIKCEPGHAAAAILPTPLVLWRYMEQRLKSTNQAYWSVITQAAEAKISLAAAPPPAAEAKISPPAAPLPAAEPKTSPPAAPPPEAEPTHGGGVVYRRRWGQLQFLLVEAKCDPRQWVLPKGHREGSETYAETAIREVHEETGVWAKVAGDLGVVTFSVDGKPLTTRFFLMRAVGWGLKASKEVDRRKCWESLEDAVKRASHDETQDLLQQASVAISALEARTGGDQEPR